VFSNSEQRAFIASNEGPEVLTAYDNMAFPAHRVDLFRYVWLWHRGGQYADVKMIMLRPLGELHEHLLANGTELCTALTWWSGRELVANGFIAAVPQHPLIRDLIAAAVKTCADGVKDWEVHCRTFAEALRRYCGARSLLDGQNGRGVYLVREQFPDIATCPGGADHVGTCSHIGLGPGGASYFRTRPPVDSRGNWWS
jgi:hypothetical protein